MKYDEAAAIISPCGRYRYRLTRTWDTKSRPAVWVMLNPSTADATTNDQTIRRCIGFGRTWGCSGIVVVNLFAYRSTDPAALLTTDDSIGPDNDAAIVQAVAEGWPVVAAWGEHPAARERAGHVVGLIAGTGMPLQCLGLTKAGHPLHPLRLRSDTDLVPYQHAVEPAYACERGAHGKRTGGGSVGRRARRPS